jgi:hypothetical protein
LSGIVEDVEKEVGSGGGLDSERARGRDRERDDLRTDADDDREEDDDKEGITIFAATSSSMGNGFSDSGLIARATENDLRFDLRLLRLLTVPPPKLTIKWACGAETSSVKDEVAFD